jgi:hypothetical protein
MKGVVTEPGCCVQVFPDPDQDLLAAFNKKVKSLRGRAPAYTIGFSLPSEGPEPGSERVAVAEDDGADQQLAWCTSTLTCGCT